MKIRLTLAVVVAVIGCKGKDTAPAKEPPAATKPEEKPTSAGDPGAGPVAKLALNDGVTCVGFTPGGNGAYLVTESKDAADAVLELKVAGDAVDPKLASEFSWTDAEAARNARDALVTKLAEALAKQTVTSCVPWQKQGETLTGKVGGKDVTVTVKGDKLNIALAGGVAVERPLEANGDAFIDSAYSSREATSVAVVLNVTAEAMSTYQIVWIAAGDLAK